MNKRQIIGFLESDNLLESIKKLMNTYQFAIENLEIFKNKTGEERQISVRCLTVGTIALVEQIASGKNPKDFTEEDWAKIAEKVSDGAIKIDAKDYSIFVFNLYAENISNAAKVYEKLLTDKAKVSLERIIEDINIASEGLMSGSISEVEYIERCLWLSLEGLLKLISATITACAGVEYSDLVQAVTQFGFELGRYKLYDREQLLLEQYLANQKILDEELEQKYLDYVDELEKYSEYFGILVRNAFDCDFRKALTGSVELARELGLSEGEILKSTEDIDDYFLS